MVHVQSGFLGIKVHTGVVEGWAYTVPGGYITYGDGGVP
jgi:hypothetical protein